MLFIIQLVLGVLFLYYGLCSILNLRNTNSKFQRLNLPNWFQIITGLTQIIGGGSLVIGVKIPVVGLFGGLWTSIMLVIGIILRIKSNERLKSMTLAFAILIGLGFIIIKNLFIVLEYLGVIR